METKTSGVKKVLKKVRSFSTSWIAKQSLDHLKDIREYELDVVLKLMPPAGKLLEIGGGTGWQAQALEKQGYEVSSIDLVSSNYLEDRMWSIIDYDGENIPFKDNTFDIIFSSNVLEHIPHVYEFQKEIHRVLKPDGRVIHVLPSGSWRFWTNISHLLKVWNIPPVHGELAGNSFSEIYYFSRPWWSRLFNKTGWEIVSKKSNRLFYTGQSIMDSRIKISSRSKIRHLLGGSCNIFVLRNRKNI